MAFRIERVQQTVDEIQTSLAAVSQAVHSGFDRVVTAIGETRHDMNVVLDAVQADIRRLDATTLSSTDGQAIRNDITPRSWPRSGPADGGASASHWSAPRSASREPFSSG